MDRLFSRLKIATCTVFCCMLFVLQGCGNSSIDVQLPIDAADQVSNDVLSGSVVVGEVTSIESTQGTKVVHIELESDIADSLLRQGTVAWIEKTDRGEVIELDASNATDQPLGADAVLIAQRRTSVDRIEQYTQRWAGNGTFITIGIAALIILMLLFGMRSLLKSIGGLIRITFSLCGAAFVSYLCNTIAADAIVKWVYPHIGDGGSSLAKDMGLPDGVVAGMADPRIVAFFIVGLIAFAFIATLLGRAVKSPDKT